MNRSLVDCPIGCRGADTNTKLTADEAAGLKAAGFDFVTRYLALTTPNNGDLTPSEAAAILAAGLGLLVVQHVRFAGWSPSRALGSQDGAAAVRQAVTCGLPRGATLWVDLEGTAPTTTADLVSGYVAGWSAEALAGGYECGAYIGAGLPAGLDAEALWHLAATRYWRSQSAVPHVANRGYQMLQLYPECRVRQAFPGAPALVGDVVVDVDVTQQDYKGSVPRMLVAT